MDSQFMDLVEIRPFKDTDRNFILNSWLLSCRGSPMFKECPDRIFYPKLTRIVQHLLDTKQVAVLCAKSDIDQITAWICFERIEEPALNTVYFAFTKKPYRELGAQTFLFGQLLGDDPVQYAIPTGLGHKVASALDAIYNPYVLLR